MRRNNKKLLTSLLILLILSIGIVYAYLTSNLSITGSTRISANSWDIHFDNLVINPNSVEATTPAAIDTNDNTKVNYSVELNQPGDIYEFTVDVVNEGSINGKVSISTLSGLDNSLSNIVDYEVKYTNGNPVNINDLLNAGATKTIRVKVYYKEDIDEDDLPDDPIDLDLSYDLQYVQTKEEEINAGNLIQNLSNTESCITKYEGQVTDRVGVTETATNVYFDKCVDKRNIIFAGYCWQMIRTTETGGIKIIYNGEPVNGKCESTRGTHKGIVGADGSSQTLSTEYLYGSSFTYDITNSTFTLLDTNLATWSDSTYENLIGKYTCKNTTGTCTTLYNVNGYKSNIEAYASYYTIGDTNYAGIGTSSFNANLRSPAMVGYMFNKVYNYKQKSPGTNTYKFGSTFTYSNGIYTLSGTTQTISDWSTGYEQINNTHYTCWNDTGTCSTISYVYYTSSSIAYYIDISNGKSVSDALAEMLSEGGVNRYNSSIKGIIDAWYAKELSSKTNMLEDTVYCNARNITDYGGWNPDGGSTTGGNTYYLKFKNYTLNNNLSCSNETDQFAVENTSAKLTYPVSLATTEELYTLTNNNNTYYSVLTKTNAYYWGLSPSYFHNNYAGVRGVNSAGNVNDSSSVSNTVGLRVAVTLSPGTVISSGSGTEADPFVISE